MSRPTGWRQVSLGEIGTWSSGGTPNTDNPKYWGGDIPWISAASLKDFRIVDSDRRVTELGARSGTRRAPAGSTLLVVRGMSLKTEFRVGIAERDVTFGQDCKCVTPGPDVHPRFLAHALRGRADEILGLVDSAGHGTGRLSTPQLQSLKIDIPGLAEQARIAEVLDTLDDAIRSTERLLSKLEVVRLGVIDSLLADLSTSSASGIETAGERTNLVRLGDVSDIASGVTLGRSVSGPDTIELPYLRVANVQDGYIDITDVKRIRVLRSELSRYELLPGDVLMTEGGDFDKLGRGAVWEGSIHPCLHQNHVFRVRCKRDLLDPRYLAIYSASPAGRRYFVQSSKQTTNLASINITQVKNFPVPIPPLDVQVRIADCLQAHSATVAREESTLAKLRQLRKGLANDLLSGRVRVEAAREIVSS